MVVAKHPAPFTDVIIERFAWIINNYMMAGDRSRVRVLDPFAGVGTIHRLNEMVRNLDGASRKVETVGIELEPKWAIADARTRVGSALDLPFKARAFDLIMTSPCYGNRMADHHNAKDGSERITYRHYYGEDLTDGSAAMMQWGQEYRDFHAAAWKEALRVLRPSGLFVVNISNHIRKGYEVPVVEWHMQTLLELGLYIEHVDAVETPRMRRGENHELRVTHEHILVLSY